MRIYKIQMGRIFTAIKKQKKKYYFNLHKDASLLPWLNSICPTAVKSIWPETIVFCEFSWFDFIITISLFWWMKNTANTNAGALLE